MEITRGQGRKHRVGGSVCGTEAVCSSCAHTRIHGSYLTFSWLFMFTRRLESSSCVNRVKVIDDKCIYVCVHSALD